MYTPGTIANSQKTPTKISKNGPYFQSKNFCGTSVRYYKAFKNISNNNS